LKDGACFVSSPVGIAEERTHKREDVDSSSPFADGIRSISIVLSQHPRQEQHQVHPDSEERQGS